MCSRPAVSTSTRSAPRACAPRSSRRTRPSRGRRPPAPDEVGAGARRPRCPSCSAAAARNVSAGGEHDRVAVVDLALRELGDGRGLAHPVHADEHPDVRLAGTCRERAVVAAVEQRHQLGVQQADERVGVGRLLRLGAVAARRRGSASSSASRRRRGAAPPRARPRSRRRSALAPQPSERGPGLAEPVPQPRRAPTLAPPPARGARVAVVSAALGRGDGRRWQRGGRRGRRGAPDGTAGARRGMPSTWSARWRAGQAEARARSAGPRGRG